MSADAKIAKQMKRSTGQLQKADGRANGLSAVAALVSTAVLLGGCAVQKKPAIPWTTAVRVRPITPQRPAETEVAEVPELAMPEAPAPLVVARTGPARPHIPTMAASRDPQPAKADTPPIVPELTAQESSTLQRETEQSLNNAERNIAATSGKSLNPTQSDLASKVRSFISDAQEAGRLGDWPRARDLAKKAQVLSEELARSL